MEHDPAKGFAKRLLQARLDAGARRGRMLTQTEVAEKLGVAQVTVGRWESGETEPDLPTIVKLAKVLGTTPSLLAFGPEKKEAAHSDSIPEMEEDRPARPTKRRRAN